MDISIDRTADIDGQPLLHLTVHFGERACRVVFPGNADVEETAGRFFQLFAALQQEIPAP